MADFWNPAGAAPGQAVTGGSDGLLAAPVPGGPVNLPIKAMTASM